MRSVDFIIVGQGLAGTLLAHELEKRKQSFIVIDGGEHNASLTSAGMVNPVVLKRFSPVWQAAAQIHQVRQTMAELSQKLTVPLDYRFDILRLFNNQQERCTWIKKAKQPALSDLLEAEPQTLVSRVINAPYGVGKVHLGGKIDVQTLLKHYRQVLQSAGCLVNEHFDYRQLVLKDDMAEYRGIEARYVVFCEGFGLKNNPFFNELPLNGNKGEVLTVRIPGLSLAQTLKSAVFIMPLPEQGEAVYFVGATYNWDDKDCRPTTAAKEELLLKLAKLLPETLIERLEVLEHRAGIRPTVADRRPLLGRHPQHRQLFVFNGLGTRGVMLGASMAPLLADHILNKQALPDVVDIKRFIG